MSDSRETESSLNRLRQALASSVRGAGLSGLVLFTVWVDSGCATRPEAGLQAQGLENENSRASRDLLTFEQLRDRLVDDVGDSVMQSYREDLNWLWELQQENGAWGGILDTSSAMLVLAEAADYEAADFGYRWIDRAGWSLWPQQNRYTGRFGGSDATLGEHVLVSLATGECYRGTRRAMLKPRVLRALGCLALTQQPDGSWYANGAAPSASDVPLATGIAQFIECAKASGLEVEPQLEVNLLSWLDGVTNLGTGAVDCTKRVVRAGSHRVRIEKRGRLAHASKAEIIAMTAAAINCRVALGQLDRAEHPVLELSGRHILDLIRRNPDLISELSPTDIKQVTYAMFHLAGDFRMQWSKHLAPRLATEYASNSRESIAQVATRAFTVQAHFRARSLESMLEEKVEFTIQLRPWQTSPHKDVIW